MLALVVVALGCVGVVLLVTWGGRARGDGVSEGETVVDEPASAPSIHPQPGDVSALFEAKWSQRRYTAKSICDALDALSALTIVEHVPEHVAQEQANCYALLLSMSRSEPRFLETLEKHGWPHVGGRPRSLDAVRQILWTKHLEALARVHAAPRRPAPEAPGPDAH